MLTSSPSLIQLRRAIELSEEIQKLEAELRSVLNGSGAAAPVKAAPVGAPAAKAPKAGKKGRKPFSAETRAKMAAAQQARWAKKGGAKVEAKAEAKPAKAAKGKRVLSPEGRARIVAALKARHAAKKQGK